MDIFRQLLESGAPESSTTMMHKKVISPLGGTGDLVVKAGAGKKRGGRGTVRGGEGRGELWRGQDREESVGVREGGGEGVRGREGVE